MSPSSTSTWKCSSNACRSRNAASKASRSALMASVKTWSSIRRSRLLAAGRTRNSRMTLVPRPDRRRRRRRHPHAEQPRRAQHADRRRWSPRSSPRWTPSRPTSRSARSSSPARRRRSAPAPTSATWPRPTARSLGNVYEGFLRIARSPLPTLAAVNGAAVGAGMNLALGCDVRLAARRAKFDTRFLQIGLHPGGGHTWMFRRIAGPQTTMAAVLFGEVLDGAEAERVGLVYRCVDDDALLDAAQAMAARAASAPRELVDRDEGDDPGHGRHRRPPGGRRAGARAAAVEHGPAVVRRAHRRAPGEDLARSRPERSTAEAAPASRGVGGRVHGTGRSSHHQIRRSIGAQRGGSPNEPTTPHRRGAVAAEGGAAGPGPQRAAPDPRRAAGRGQPGQRRARSRPTCTSRARRGSRRTTRIPRSPRTSWPSAPAPSGTGR